MRKRSRSQVEDSGINYYCNISQMSNVEFTACRKARKLPARDPLSLAMLLEGLRSTLNM